MRQTKFNYKGIVFYYQNLLPKFLILLVLLISSESASAHLLNMTEAYAVIDSQNTVTMDLRLDLLAELGSKTAYYEFSKLSGQDVTITYADMLERLTKSIEIKQGNQTTSLKFVQIEPPIGYKLSDFQSNFVWPMTDLRLQAELPSSAPIKIQFQTQFIFEEPIALTMISSARDKRKSRWLVAGQTSPIFEISNTNLITSDSQSLDSSNNLNLTSLWSYVSFGFVHILPSGWDHLLFLLMLYLSVNSFKQLLIRISLFTLAHSITLGLASYRIIQIPALLTETLISISILALAVSNLIKRNDSAKKGEHFNLHGYLIIFAFGLLHGLGFASSLMSLAQPLEHFLISLLSFNIGVELGQLAFLAIVFIAINIAKKAVSIEKINRALAIVTAIIIFAWLVQMHTIT